MATVIDQKQELTNRTKPGLETSSHLLRAELKTEYGESALNYIENNDALDKSAEEKEIIELFKQVETQALILGRGSN